MTGGREPTGWDDLARRTASGERILVVDDNASVRESLSRMVRSLGYECDAASSSEEAEQWLGGNEYGLMLLDIDLPRMNGYEMLRWTLGRHPELPVIMITGIDDREMAVECLEAGARTYLVKPVHSDFLRVALRDALSMRQLLRAYNRRRED